MSEKVCPGSGKPPELVTHFWVGLGSSGNCAVCGHGVMLTSAGNIYRHVHAEGCDFGRELD
jgi:hypothetical protein